MTALPFPRSPGIVEGLSGVTSGRLHPRAWVAACLARIADRDATVRAWAHLAQDPAPADRPPSDRSARPLHGLPFGVKDVIDVAGMPTGCNSPIEEGRIAAVHALAVQRLIDAGAVCIGKTVTTEYAFLTPGPTRNPLDPTRTPGGSSSGSAAAVADRHVPLALTTQTGGSTIRPAAYCGIVGYKPPFGTVPTAGLRLLAPSLDTVGLHARSVADACLAASVLEARPRSLDTRVDPRFVVLRLPGEATEAGPEIATMMERVADALRACGACVEEIASPAALAPLDAAHRTIMSCEVARSFAGLSRSDGDRLSRPLRDFIDRGRRESDHALSRAHAEASEAHRALWPVVAGGAVLICPAAPGEAPVGLGSTGNARFNRPWSLLRYAALTIPSGRGPNGLPLGLQLVDPSPWADRLFPAAAFAERALKPLLAET